MSRNATAGPRAAFARLGRAVSRLGGLPQRAVTWGGEHRGAAAAVVIIVAEVAAGAIIAAAPLRPGGAGPVHPDPATGAAASYPARPPFPVRAVLPLHYTGVYEPTGAGSYVPVGRGDRAADAWPKIAISYSGWYLGFNTGFAVHARAVHAIPLIQIEPRGVSLATIARGAYDSHLRAYADAVASYRGAVIIGFGQEMNERMYTWGYRKASPAVFIRAWRHIVDVFRSQHADNVIWMWTIGKSSATASPIRGWWPGVRYVTWIGIDGYYELPGRPRLAAFAWTIARIRRMTADPVLLFAGKVRAR